MSSTRLYYIHDPMCSWCYAFKPVYQQLLKKLPDTVKVSSLLGGLAADTEQPMPVEMQQQLKNTWQRIEQKVPGIQFNFDYWKHAKKTKPRRSTWLACRAVIAAAAIKPEFESLMIAGIQTAYYQQATNPSDPETLIEIAQQLGFNAEQFKQHLNAAATQQELDRQIAFSRQLNVSSFPSLVLQTETSHWPVSIDYNHYQPILDTINMILDFD